MTLAEAEYFYRQMGCTHFHMSREEPSKYDQYKSLNITEEQERRWRCDEVAELIELLSRQKPPQWNTLDSLLSVAERTEETLADVAFAAEKYATALAPLGKVIIAETILGCRNPLNSGTAKIARLKCDSDTANRLKKLGFMLLKQAGTDASLRKRIFEAFMHARC